MRCKTGVLLVDADFLGRESDLAARIGADALDYGDLILRQLPPGARFAGLGSDREEGRLDDVAMRDAGADCVLVSSFDLALAHLSSDARGRLWANLFGHFSHRRRALVLGMPVGATALLPCCAQREPWIAEGRLVGTQDY